MNKPKILFPLSTLLILASCGGRGSSSSEDSSSSSTSSEEPSYAETLTFNEAASLIADSLYKNELDAVKETRKDITEGNGLLITQEGTYTIYSDGSSSYAGKYTDRNSKEASINGRNVIEKAKVETEDGGSTEVNFLYNVTEYNGAKDNEAARNFVFEDENEANKYGFEDEDTYYTTVEAKQTCLAGLSAYLYSGLGAIISDTYAAQTSVKGFTLNSKDGDIYSYASLLTYEYDDDDLGGVVTQKYNVSFSVDTVNNRLTAMSYESSLSEIEKGGSSTDAYTSGTSVSGTIEYAGTKEKAGDGLLDPKDYFLQQVTEIDVTDGYGEALDASAIPYTNLYYVFAKAKEYAPAKAVDVAKTALIPVSSSNESVIKESKGYFEAKGLGTTTLTWSYYGLDSETQMWKEVEISKEVTLVTPAPTKITLYTASITPNVVDNTMYVGQTYSQQIAVSPAGASTDCTATSSDESVMNVSVTNGKITYTPIGAGTVTITVTSTVDTSVSTKLTFKVLDNTKLTDEEIANMLKGASFKRKSSSGNEYTISINSDGTGSITIGNYTDSFNWTVSNGKFNPTSFSYKYGIGTDEEDVDPWEITIIDGKVTKMSVVDGNYATWEWIRNEA